MSSRRGPAAILAVDGGNSKLDAVVVAADGRVLGAARGRGASFAPGDHDESFAELARTVHSAARAAGIDPERGAIARVGVHCLAGADLPVDDRRLQKRLRELAWSPRIVLRNDTFAVLRAGTDRTWGVGVVCGTGLNCAAVSPDGRIVRYAALGEISGDGGGGDWLGLHALRAAIRGRDLRGPHSVLERDVPAHFGMRTPSEVMEAIYLGRIDQHRLTELPRLVFKASSDGDPAAGEIVDRLADEIVAMVISALRRLRMTRRDTEVVLGGGVARGRDPRLLGRIGEGVAAVAPSAQVSVVDAPPVIGSALLGLDEIGARKGAYGRVRSALTHDRMADPRRER
jgi:N-acetylglucosamine kinase-like BadF-type ATPase